MAQRVKCLPAVQETWIRSPDGEDPLEKEMAAHSSPLAWKIPWTGEPARLYSPWDCKELDRKEPLHFSVIPRASPGNELRIVQQEEGGISEMLLLLLLDEI